MMLAPMKLTSEPIANTEPEMSCSTNATTMPPGRAGAVVGGHGRCAGEGQLAGGGVRGHPPGGGMCASGGLGAHPPDDGACAGDHPSGGGVCAEAHAPDVAARGVCAEGRPSDNGAGCG